MWTSGRRSIESCAGPVLLSTASFGASPSLPAGSLFPRDRCRGGGRLRWGRYCADGACKQCQASVRGRSSGELQRTAGRPMAEWPGGARCAWRSYMGGETAWLGPPPRSSAPEVLRWPSCKPATCSSGSTSERAIPDSGAGPQSTSRSVRTTSFARATGLDSEFRATQSMTSSTSCWPFGERLESLSVPRAPSSSTPSDGAAVPPCSRDRQGRSL